MWRFSGSGSFTTEIVFVGYGIHAPEKGYDDYAGVNVKGKIALMALGIPLKYHRTRDDVDLIKPELLRRTEEKADPSFKPL